MRNFRRKARKSRAGSLRDASAVKQPGKDEAEDQGQQYRLQEEWLERESLLRRALNEKEGQMPQNCNGSSEYSCQPYSSGRAWVR